MDIKNLPTVKRISGVCILCYACTSSAFAQVISVTPVSQSLSVGERTEVTVMIEVDSPMVIAFQAYLNLGPELALVNGSLQRNTSLWNLKAKQEVEGNQNQVAAAASGQNGVPRGCESGMCELFSFTVEAVSNGSAALAFDREKTLGQDNQLNDVSFAFEDSSIQVSSTGSTAPGDFDEDGRIEDTEISKFASDWITGADSTIQDTDVSLAGRIFLAGGCYAATANGWDVVPCK